MGKDADCCDACRIFGDETKPPPPPPPPAPRAHADQVKLVVESCGERRELLPTGPQMKVGRGSKCEIQLNDSALSRVQCVVTFDERGVFIQDSGSTCGTIVDGRNIQGLVPLKVGTTVYFGNSRLRVVAR